MTSNNAGARIVNSDSTGEVIFDPKSGWIDSLKNSGTAKLTIEGKEIDATFVTTLQRVTNEQAEATKKLRLEAAEKARLAREQQPSKNDAINELIQSRKSPTLNQWQPDQ